MALLEKLKTKLDEIYQHYQQLKAKSESPDFYNDPAQSAKIMKELSSLKPIAELFEELKKNEQDLETAKQMLKDPEMKELADEEMPIIKEKIEKITDELIGLLITSDEKDSRDVIFEIRAGTGGEEAGLFAADLFRMYVRYAERKKWKVEILNSYDTDLGGFKEIVFIVKGADVYKQLKYETGGHRVQRVPKTETQGRVHTSAATVTVLPQVEDVEVEIDQDDLRIDRFCSSGKGGQHVNRTESAIRVTHLPTGIVVSCQDERSQHQNLARAMSVLRSKLYELEKKKQEAKRSDIRAQSGSGDRSEKIRTYNWPQNRVTDHRLGKNFSLEIIIDGQLDKLIEDLKAWDKAEKLARLQ